MRISAVVLDSTPLGLITQQTGKSLVSDNCRLWIERLLSRGVRIYIPEIADYEVRRELMRAKKQNSILRLDKLKMSARYLPISTDIMLLAAELWAKSRNSGMVTSANGAIDGDVIVASQAISLCLSQSEYVVATSNIKHISAFAPADLWSNIN